MAYGFSARSLSPKDAVSLNFHAHFPHVHVRKCHKNRSKEIKNRYEEPDLMGTL